MLATFRIPAVGETTDLADDCGDLARVVQNGDCTYCQEWNFSILGVAATSMAHAGAGMSVSLVRSISHRCEPCATHRLSTLCQRTTDALVSRTVAECLLRASKRGEASSNFCLQEHEKGETRDVREESQTRFVYRRPHTPKFPSTQEKKDQVPARKLRARGRIDKIRRSASKCNNTANQSTTRTSC